MTDRPRATSAIVWFDGYGPDSPHYLEAIGAGGFVLDGRVWPAAVEVSRADQEPRLWPRRVGIDVERRCFVVESEVGHRVLLNIDGAAAVLQLGRIAIGEASPVT